MRALGEQIAFNELSDLVLGQVPCDIGLADDADQAVVLDHGQPAHLVFFHDG